MVRGQELPTAYVRAKFEDRSFFRLRNIERVPTKVFRRLSEYYHFKTTRRSLQRRAAPIRIRGIFPYQRLYDIGESNPVPASGL